MKSGDWIATRLEMQFGSMKWLASQKLFAEKEMACKLNEMTPIFERMCCHVVGNNSRQILLFCSTGSPSDFKPFNIEILVRILHTHIDSTHATSKINAKDADTSKRIAAAAAAAHNHNNNNNAKRMRRVE